ncbi:MAG TPA: TlpA family protein disulfide reductase, partial [Bacteroidales bacterium]|nr:TlpA family protein disulfide reductase [Bacteroidales bacterium]
MLFPTSRKTVSAFIVRYTMLAPRESSRTVILDQQERQLRLVTYDGELVSLEELSDKPVFLNYWGTWCPPCIAELPSLQNLYNAYKEEVHFVFVSNEDPETV